MDEGLALGHEGELGPAHGTHHDVVSNQGSGIPLVRRNHIVASAEAEGFGEDEILGDCAQLRVRRSSRDDLLFLGIHAEDGRSECDRRDVLAHEFGSALVHEPVIECTPPHPVVRKILHAQDVAIGIEVVNLGHQVRRMAPVKLKCFDLVAGSFGGHWPIRADEPHVWEGLLEDETTAMCIANDEHEIEVSVAHLRHIGDRSGIDPISQPWLVADVVGDGVYREKGVRHGSSESLAGEGGGDPAVNRDHGSSRP